MSGYKLSTHVRSDNPYGAAPRRSLLRTMLLATLAILFVGIVVGGATGYFWYSNNTGALDVSASEQITITIEEGATENEISQQLESMGVIKSASAYQLYLRLQRKQGLMQAGVYDVSAALSVSEIVALFSAGENAVTTLTILPGKRIDQIEQTFIDAGYSAAEIQSALDPAAYANHPALADKPVSSSLEGYLFPETFITTASTPLGDVIRLSLDEMALALDAATRQQLVTVQGLTLNESVVIASIVEKEVSNLEDKPKVAQVFLKRLRENISLGSDVTAFYGSYLNGEEDSVFTDSLYNTRIYPGLPPGPISNFSADTLQAVAYPADTDYLFFVAGDDGVTYFSDTLAQHEALTAQHCIELCR